MHRVMTLCLLVTVTVSCRPLSIPCDSQRDCRSEELCYQGTCCTPCNATVDCAGDEACRDGLCVPAATVDDATADDAAVDDAAVDDAAVGDVAVDTQTSDAHAGDLVDARAPDSAGSFDAGVGDSGPRVDGARADAGSGDAAAATPAIKVVLLAGQSNMVGAGLVSELPSGLLAPTTGVYIHDEGEVDATLTGAWVPLAPGFGASLAHVGPELSFGLEIQRLRPRPLWGLIKHAVSATSLGADWDPATGPLYASFIDHARRALAALAPYGRAEVAGLIWMQGESDSFTQADADGYQARLTNFIARVRSDLALPNLPVVVGLISTATEWTYGDRVRAAQTAVADAVAQVGLVETADLPRDLALDPYHYTAAGQVTLGQRFATALGDLLTTSHSFASDFALVNGERNWFYVEHTGSGYVAMTPQADHWQGGSQYSQIAPGVMHPDVNAPELAWLAPGSGRVTVRASVHDADTTCGEGVRVSALVDGQTVVWGPLDLAADAGSPRSFALDLWLGQNQFIGFRTEAGATPWCDLTAWNIELEFAWDE